MNTKILTQKLLMESALDTLRIIEVHEELLTEAKKKNENGSRTQDIQLLKSWLERDQKKYADQITRLMQSLCEDEDINPFLVVANGGLLKQSIG